MEKTKESSSKPTTDTRPIHAKCTECSNCDKAFSSVTVASLILLLSLFCAGIFSSSKHSYRKSHSSHGSETLYGGGGGHNVPHMASAMHHESFSNLENSAPKMATMRSRKGSFTTEASLGQKHEINDLHEDNAQQNRMLVYHGNMNIQSKRESLQSLSDSVKDFVSNHGGYVERSNSEAGYMDHRRGKMANARINMNLRVPSHTFRATMNYLRSLADSESDILSESESVSDVTEQYIDKSSRAAALESSHKALLRLLEEAKSTKDVLAVRRELRQVVQELESKKAQMKSLKSQSEFSSIHVTLNQRPLGKDTTITIIPWPSWDPLMTLEISVKSLCTFCYFFLDKLVITIVFAVPITVIFFTVWRCCLCFKRCWATSEIENSNV